MSASMSSLNRSALIDGDPPIDLATSVVGGKVYAIGGYQDAMAAGLTTVEEYDPSTDSWTTKSDMPTGGAACVPDSCT